MWHVSTSHVSKLHSYILSNSTLKHTGTWSESDYVIAKTNNKMPFVGSYLEQHATWHSDGSRSSSYVGLYTSRWSLRLTPHAKKLLCQGMHNRTTKPSVKTYRKMTDRRLWKAQTTSTSPLCWRSQDAFAIRIGVICLPTVSHYWLAVRWNEQWSV